MDAVARAGRLRWTGAAALAMIAAAGASPTVKAAPMYTIRDLGTLPGTTMSVATSINNNGQVVGVSYNSSDGTFVQNFPGSANPPRFVQNNGAGGQSFLYTSGQMTSINPIGGLALSINASGQVVGGQFTSINASGQYVGAPGAGVQGANLDQSNPSQAVFVSEGTSTPIGVVPYAVNNAGQTSGFMWAGAGDGGVAHPAIYQGGRVTDLASTVAQGNVSDGRAIALNQRGDALINVALSSQQTGSYVYDAASGKALSLSALSGGAGMIGSALNSKDQVVGNGFLYSNGIIQALAGLIPPASGWSSLNATGINDQGQIVGQGLIGGQEHAFLMTPDSNQVPEPGAFAVWGLMATGAVLLSKRGRHRQVNR